MPFTIDQGHEQSVFAEIFLGLSDDGDTETESIEIQPELSIKSLLFEEASISDLPDEIQAKFLTETTED